MNPLIQHRHEQRLGRQCDWSKCSRPVDRKTFSRFCKKHRDAIRKNGHPEAKRIFVRELKPYVSSCQTFIEKNLDHAGVQAALKWIEGVSKENASTPFLSRTGHQKTATRHWVEWCARLNVNATPLQVLSTVAAFYAHREDDPRRYPSDMLGDKYFDFQMGLYVARLAPRRDRKTRNASIGVPPTLVHAISKRLQGALAVLAQRIGVEVHKGIVRGIELKAQYEGKSAYLIGSHLPFGVVVCYLPPARRSRPGQTTTKKTPRVSSSETPKPPSYASAEYRGLSEMALKMIQKSRLSDAQQNKGTEN